MGRNGYVLSISNFNKELDQRFCMIANQGGDSLGSSTEIGSTEKSWREIGLHIVLSEISLVFEDKENFSSWFLN